MEGFWWNSGIFFCVICTVVGIIGNGLTIAIFGKYERFRNFFGFYILRYVKISFFAVIKIFFH